MGESTTVCTSYQFKDVDVRVILLNDSDMHHADAIWKATGRSKGKAPDDFLRSPDAKRYLTALAAKVGVPAERLWYYDASGHWFTQLLAVEYAGWIDQVFRVMVNRLATMAAQELARRKDPLFQEVRQLGKVAHAEASTVRDKFAPLIDHGKDMKHPYANAAICRAIKGKNPREVRETELGGKKGGSIWDHATLQENANRLYALAHEIPKLERLRLQTSDPRRMIAVVEDNTRQVVAFGHQLEQGEVRRQ